MTASLIERPEGWTPAHEAEAARVRLMGRVVDLVELVMTTRTLRASSEAELNETLGVVLKKAYGAELQREVKLSEADRIDFMIGRIGIELKIQGGLSDVTRQLHRYAGSSELDALVLVTKRMAHRRVPLELRGKPVRVATLFTRMF